MSRWRRISAIGALGYRGSRRSAVYLSLRREAIRTPDLIRFLGALRRHVRGPVELLWDNLSAHKSQAMLAFLATQSHWLHVHRLPAYAPELYPVEGLWAWIKGGPTANLAHSGLEGIEGTLRRTRRQLSRRSDLLEGFLRKTRLSP